MRNTTVWALDCGVFPDPVINAAFAEQLAAGITFKGVSYNLAADEAIEIIKGEGNEPVLVVAGGVHIC